jgi:hypothetical protein
MKVISLTKIDEPNIPYLISQDGYVCELTADVVKRKFKEGKHLKVYRKQSKNDNTETIISLHTAINPLT